MVNLSCTQWKHYTLSYLEIDYYCHYCYLYNFYKSLFKLSDWNPRHPIQRLQQATHRTGVKLVSVWIFFGYSLGSSWDFTEVHPVLAAGGRLAHLQNLALNHWDWFRDGLWRYICVNSRASKNTSTRAQISLSRKLFRVTCADFNCCAH